MDPKTYVKKWMRTQHALLFRLSTALIQVSFKDNTEVFIATDTKLITYKSKRQIKKTYSMEEALLVQKKFEGPHVKNKSDFEQEFFKRLKYAKEIIETTLGGGVFETDEKPARS